MHEAADQTVQMIEAADQAGLDSVWISEDPDGWDAFAVLAAATWTTRHIRLGTGVTNPYLRHPNLLAMSVSTLDRLSGGRAFLGLGRGQPEWYRESLGVATDSPLRTLESTIRLLHQWWQPPYRAHSRTGVTVKDWARAIGPAQERPPIYIAALGPKALDLAARMADGLLVADFGSIQYLEKMIPEMREKLEEYGRDPEKFHFYVRTGIERTDNTAPSLRYRKTLMALLAPLPGMSRQIVHPDYDIDEIIEQLSRVMGTREVLKRGGNFIDVRNSADFEAARALIPDELIEDLSYVGDADYVRSKLNRLKSIGVTHVFLAPPAKPDPDAIASQIDALTERERDR
jgi:5,10-methylenetetrahydromethanopterin reductase